MYSTSTVKLVAVLNEQTKEQKRDRWRMLEVLNASVTISYHQQLFLHKHQTTQFPVHQGHTTVGNEPAMTGLKWIVEFPRR